MKNITYCLTLPKSLMDSIKEIADEQGKTKKQVIREAVELYLSTLKNKVD